VSDIKLSALCGGAWLCVSVTAFATGPATEIERLLEQVPDVELVQLPATGVVQLTAEQSLTIDKLRNVAIDSNPPLLTRPAVYPEKMGDGAAQGSEPYIAANVAPFRLHRFRTEWNFAGWHTWEMSDYALQHGFQLSVLYNNRQPADVPVSGSEFLHWVGFSWSNWLASHADPNGQPHVPQRWDQVPPRAELVPQLLAQNLFAYRAGVSQVMLDLEDPTYPEAEASLRQKSWYPPGGPNAEFENAYYDGFVDMELAAAETATRQGWPEVGIYGWAPFPRAWFGLESVSIDPSTFWPWVRFGRQIYRSPSIGILYPSVYSFYWDERNVAYVLANIDLNQRLVNSEPIRKKVRPYFWNQLHGGGPGWRWWGGLPIRNEDMRAMVAMTFFTGVDGLTLWSWSGTTNPHVVDPAACTDYSVAEDFQAVAESGASATIRRYDAIHVLEMVAAVARFQVIDMASTRAQSYGTDRPKTYSTASPEGYDHRCWQAGDPLLYPVYSLPVADLKALLRPMSDSIRAVVEALALASPVEATLFGGSVKVDVSAQEQFGTAAPIVRRVDNAGFAIVATYDPQWQTFPAGRTVTLTDFDGRDGLTLQIPADRETRFFLLRLE
jgi:hypothetical protein